jgi:hypothetical protein
MKTNRQLSNHLKFGMTRELPTTPPDIFPQPYSI